MGLPSVALAKGGAQRRSNFNRKLVPSEGVYPECNRREESITLCLLSSTFTSTANHTGSSTAIPRQTDRSRLSQHHLSSLGRLRRTNHLAGYSLSPATSQRILQSARNQLYIKARPARTRLPVHTNRKSSPRTPAHPS